MSSGVVGVVCVLLDAHKHTFACTWTKEAESHRQPHPGEMFWPVFPFSNSQPGFCRACFLPLPRQPDPATSKGTNTKTHLCLYIAVKKTHPATFHVDTQKTDHRLIQESEAQTPEAKKKTNLGHDISE